MTPSTPAMSCFVFTMHGASVAFTRREVCTFETGFNESFGPGQVTWHQIYLKPLWVMAIVGGGHTHRSRPSLCPDANLHFSDSENVSCKMAKHT